MKHFSWLSSNSFVGKVYLTVLGLFAVIVLLLLSFYFSNKEDIFAYHMERSDVKLVVACTEANCEITSGSNPTSIVTPSGSGCAAPCNLVGINESFTDEENIWVLSNTSGGEYSVIVSYDYNSTSQVSSGKSLCGGIIESWFQQDTDGDGEGDTWRLIGSESVSTSETTGNTVNIPLTNGSTSKKFIPNYSNDCNSAPPPPPSTPTLQVFPRVGVAYVGGVEQYVAIYDPDGPYYNGSIETPDPDNGSNNAFDVTGLATWSVDTTTQLCISEDSEGCLDNKVSSYFISYAGGTVVNTISQPAGSFLGLKASDIIIGSGGSAGSDSPVAPILRATYSGKTAKASLFVARRYLTPAACPGYGSAGTGLLKVLPGNGVLLGCLWNDNLPSSGVPYIVKNDQKPQEAELWDSAPIGNFTAADPVPDNFVAIDYNWGTGTINENFLNSPPIGDYVLGMWRGKFKFKAGTYRFTLEADNTARLYIDNDFDPDPFAPNRTWNNTNSGGPKINVTNGVATWNQTFTTQDFHNLKLEYSEVTGSAKLKLSWEYLPPAPVINAATSATCGGFIDVSWTAVPGATSYKLYRDGGATPIYTGTATSFSDAVAPGTSHTYRVRSVHSSGYESALSNPTPPTLASATCPAVGSHNLNVIPSGRVTATSTPVGINCGTTCTKSFTQGTVVNLNATCAAKWVFNKWDNDCTGTNPNNCSVTMNSDKTVRASCKPDIDYKEF